MNAQKKKKKKKNSNYVDVLVSSKERKNNLFLKTDFTANLNLLDSIKMKMGKLLLILVKKAIIMERKIDGLT